MKNKLMPRISRYFAAFAAAVLLAVMLPGTVFAATVPTLSFTNIKVGELVTVHGENFPQSTNFTVRMDKIGNQAIDGTIVGYVNSKSGSFEATYYIPTKLENETLIAIRMDSSNGWYSYNWFTNKASSELVSPEPSTKPYIEIIGVKANESVTVQAHRFPARETFKIRIGSFTYFFKDFVVVDSIYTGNGGSFKFTVDLPESVKNVEMVTIRLDSESKQYAYNAFKNVDAGSVESKPTPLPGKGSCEVLSVSPSTSVNKWEDFDVVWTVKNTSKNTWDLQSVDYKFVSGTKMHKYSDAYDFTQSVKTGEIVKITVDMLAPAATGTYTANWAIVQGSTTLCALPFSVYVK